MKKPSKIQLATAKKTWWVPASFLYVMLFGTAWCAEQKTADKFNATEDNEDRVHETIHIRQAVSKSDSWLLYYLEYCWEWICNIPLIFVKWYAAYKFMPMEIEAYGRQDEPNYIWSSSSSNPVNDNCYGREDNPNYIDFNECTGWRTIKKDYPLSKRKELAKEWYNGIDEETGYPWRYGSFNKFIRKYFDF